jgi:cell division protease FtsH
MWGMIVLMALMISQGILKYSMPGPEKLSYSEFKEKVRSGAIASVEVHQNEIRGNYVAGQAVSEDGQAESAPEKFQTQWLGQGDELSIFLEEQKEAKAIQEYSFVSEQNDNFLRNFVLYYIPVGISIFILILIFRQMQMGGGGKAMSFGKSRARMMDESKKKVTFKDVAGVDEAKEELEEIIEFLKEPKKFTDMGVRIPKGVLLVGPPGTGKTLLAKAVAGEAGVPFYSISGSDFVEMFVGVGASRVRDLFEQGRKNSPCIIFIDEIDAVGRHRGAGMGGGHDEREQTLNQLLVEMDGFEAKEGVILIAATNRVDVLDPALLRPGRFDRHVMVPHPAVKGREEILQVHSNKIPMDESVDLSVIARGTVGFSGADLENLVNEAGLLAARQGAKKVTMHHFEDAKDKLMLGKERKSVKMSDEEKEMTAYHEAGHALVAKLTPGADPVHKVTIVPRGMALGVTFQLPEKDKYSMKKDEIESIISVLMGGRIAEEVVYGRISNGAANDIEKASDLARKMVCEWGMSEVIGPLSYKQKENQIFVARDMADKNHFSEKTAEKIDAEIRQVVMSAYDRAKDIIVKHRDTLDRIAKLLLEKEIIDSKDLNDLMDQANPA